MGHLIGRGRYARETYPGSNGAVGRAVIQVGYDQVVGDDFLIPPAEITAFFPRNVADDPLSVALPNVHEGNVLEVDFRACLEKDSSYYYIQEELSLVALVSFDGNPPVLVPSATTFIVVDASTGHTDITDTVLNDEQPTFNVTALAAVPIPAGATTATVQMAFSSSAGLVVSGDPTAETPELFATLKVSELNGAIVSQPGPGSLIPTGP